MNLIKIYLLELQALMLIIILHAQRIYNYISNLWFMPATPVLSNGGTERGLPISCFLNEAGDSLMVF